MLSSTDFPRPNAHHKMELDTVIPDSDFLDTVDSRALITSPSGSFASPGNDDDDDDEIYHSARETLEIEDQLKKLEKELRRALEIRQQQTEPELRSLKRDIEESYDKSRKAKIGGTVATVTGSALGIVGFGLAFVTFGASLSLLVIGGVVGAAGGATVAGADIGYLVVSQKRMKRVKEVCRREERQQKRVQDVVECIRENLEELRRCFPQYTEEELLEMIYEGRGGDSNVTSFLANHAIDIGRVAVVAGDATRIGTQVATRTVWKTLGLAGRVVGGAGAAMDIILVPFDVFVMVKAALDVHKYQGGKGKSNSNSACKVGKILVELGEHTEKMKTMHDDLLRKLEHQ